MKLFWLSCCHKYKNKNFHSGAAQLFLSSMLLVEEALGVSASGLGKKTTGFMLNVRAGFNLDFLALAWFCKWHVESCICFLWLRLFAAEEEEGAIIFTLVLTTLLLIRLYYEYYCIIHKFSPRPKSWSKWTVPICMQENHFNYLKNITSSFRVANFLCHYGTVLLELFSFSFPSPTCSCTSASWLTMKYFTQCTMSQSKEERLPFGVTGFPNSTDMCVCLGEKQSN